MSANEKQVSGTHYQTKKGGVQHWDYCGIVNVPYLESAATKYLTRWYKKNGVADLQKAQHYMEKRVELYRNHQGILKAANRNQGLFNRYIEDNQIPHHEREVIDLIMHWKSVEQLENILVRLQDLVDDAECGPTSVYVNQGN